jgi:predicted enzyme related to lactoylglutathione lyase
MGERTSHPPGTFSWADLGTTDAAGAKAFYTALFGWEAEDMPVPGGGGPYTMMRIDGKSVAAVYPMQQEGQPPAWLAYVTVEDADATAAKAKELGATLIDDPFDVMDVGRMVVIRDPQGAVFAAWQPRTSIGAQLVNDPGSMTWNDLGTPDVDASARFYEGLFGWRVEALPEAGGSYSVIWNGERTNGGVRPLQEGEPVPWWSVYFTVTDLDGALARAGELGGGTLVPPMEVTPGRRFATVRDPQGAVFNLYEGDIDD